MTVPRSAGPLVNDAQNREATSSCPTSPTRGGSVLPLPRPPWSFLRAERLREPVERPSRLGITHEILTIHGFRVRRASGREERCSERLAGRLLPRGRLVMERVLHPAAA
jgi:hypothetical protein